MAQDELKRKIYFYRVVPDQRPQDGDWRFDRAAVARAINGHVGKDSFYLDEGGDRITCAELAVTQPPHGIKLYAIRRTNLPSRDSGTGTIGDLGLAVDEGLAEAVHLRMFPNGIIGFESFFYGPRIGRFEAYLRERCNIEASVSELYRGDMLDRALKFEDIRVLRVKINPSHISREEARDAGIKGLVDVANNFDAGIYADVTLRSERHDPAFTTKVKDLIRRYKNDGQDPSEMLSAFDIEGENPESGKVEALNLLNDALQRQVSIPREDYRTRALDSRAAFRAISDAYDQVKTLLPTDAVAN